MGRERRPGVGGGGAQVPSATVGRSVPCGTGRAGARRGAGRPGGTKRGAGRVGESLMRMTTELLPTPLLSPPASVPANAASSSSSSRPRRPGTPHQLTDHRTPPPCIGSGDQNECVACRGEPSHPPCSAPSPSPSDPCGAQCQHVASRPVLSVPVAVHMLPVVPTAKPESHGGSCPKPTGRRT